MELTGLARPISTGRGAKAPGTRGSSSAPPQRTGVNNGSPLQAPNLAERRSEAVRERFAPVRFPSMEFWIQLLRTLRKRPVSLNCSPGLLGPEETSVNVNDLNRQPPTAFCCLSPTVSLTAHS